ncbi:MAG: cytochrome c [Rhodospirillaceae bacterium]|nr:cytochrome c [Rhodospirillaceae bacterium]
MRTSARKRTSRLRLLSFLAFLTYAAGVAPAVGAGDAGRGHAVFDAAGCLGCHTDKKNKGAPLAVGRALKTPFGTFFSPNITPDMKTGIGKWSDDDFVRALRHGVSPKGSNYFPAFPYPSYTRMTDADMLDLKAYLFSLAPVAQANTPHDMDFPFGFRFPLVFWKALYFTAGAMKDNPDKSKEWNRGAYLVEALGHCGEWHTPRGALGGAKTDMHMAGTRNGGHGEIVPNITPDKQTGIGTWSTGDIEMALSIGMLPDSDFVGGSMGEVVTNTTGRWSKSDRRAVVIYLQSLPAIDHKVKKDKPKDGGGNNWD